MNETPTRPDNFDVYLQDRRDRKGYTRRSLAGRLGISPQYLCDIEKGNRPPLGRIIESAIAILDLDRYEAYWVAGRLPPEIEELPLEAGPDEWRRLDGRYGRGL